MACYHPITAYKTADGSVVFHEKAYFNIIKTLSLPCNQCIGCRLERSRQWAMRCMHEAQLHEENCFITLTYNKEHLPYAESLNHEHFKLFIKRLRKKLAPKRIRFYMAGEYGTKGGRPHYHAAIFGWRPNDLYEPRKTKAGSLIYQSKVLEDCWRIRNKNTGEYESIGLSSVGELTFESAAYIARYICTKVTGKGEAYKYHNCYTDIQTGEIVKRVPEYNKMSLKSITGIKGMPGGIAADWYLKYKTDVYPHDYVVVRGMKMKPPKYYDKILKKQDFELFEEITYQREKSAKINYLDNTPERLAVKEQVAQARLNRLKRNLT
jgi:hypothetical protein